MNQNIFLIGFMGVGKTAVGKRLAEKMGKKFFDSDREIEKLLGMNIQNAYKKMGKLRMQSEEKLILNKLIDEDKAVISLGGSMIFSTDNIEKMKKRGRIICLTAPKEIIMQRIKRRNNRPLLKNGCLFENIERLYEERIDYYKLADFSYDTSEFTLEALTNHIIENINLGK